MITDERLEGIAMTMIASAGNAKSLTFDALAAAKKGGFSEAEELLNQAAASLSEAQATHRELLQLYALGQVPYADILLSHALDHFMNATLAHELVGEMIQLYKQAKP